MNSITTKKASDAMTFFHKKHLFQYNIILITTAYHLWIKTFYLQTAEYEQLKTTTKYNKSDGPCLNALYKVLKTKNV